MAWRPTRVARFFVRRFRRFDLVENLLGDRLAQRRAHPRFASTDPEEPAGSAAEDLDFDAIPRHPQGFQRRLDRRVDAFPFGLHRTHVRVLPTQPVNG
jgi:hypothetical protein